MATITNEMYREFDKAVKAGVIPMEALKGVGNESDATVQALLGRIRNLQQPQELKSDKGGLFEYDVDYKGNQATITKDEKLSPENLKDVYAKEYNVPADSLGDLSVNERIIDDPTKLADYIMNNNLNKDMSRLEVERSIAGTPRWAKAQILEKGVLPQAWSLVGDFASGAGRGLSGLYEHFAGNGDALTEMGTTEPTAKGFIPSLGQSILKSPITPIAIGSGGLLNASTKTGMALKGGLAGLGEGLAEESFRDASGETSSGFGDYAQSGAFGGAFGAGAPFVPTVIKNTLGGALDLTKKGVIGVSKSLSNRLGAGVEAGLTKSPASTGNASSLDVGKELGISLEDMPQSIIHGENSTMARAERAVAQGSEGQGAINKYNNAYDKVNQRLGEFSNAENALDKEEAGALLIDGLEASRSNLFNENTSTYASVLDDVDLNNQVNDALSSEFAPNLQENLFYAIDGINKELGSAVDKKQISSLMDARDALTKITDKLEVADEGGNTYEMLNGVRQSIGNIAYDKNIGKFEYLDSYLKTLRKAERDISTTLSDAVSSASPEKGELLRKTNKAISEHFNDEKSISKILDRDLGGEKNFKAIFGDSKKIKTAKAIFERNGQGEAFNQARDSWMNKVLLSKSDDGKLNFKTTLNRIKENEHLIKSAYGEDAPKVIATYKNLLGFGNELGARFMQGSAGQLDWKNVITDPIRAKIGKGVLASQSYGDVSRLGGVDPRSKSQLNLPFRALGRGIEQTLAKEPEMFKNWYNQEENANLNQGLTELGKR